MSCSKLPLFSGKSVWRISDNNTLFQLSVFRDLYESGRYPRGAPPSLDQRLVWLERLEGPMLEELTAEWLRGRTDGGLAITEARYDSPSGGGEIDVAALLNQDDGSKAILAECKRSAAKHRPGLAAERFDAFMSALGDAAAQGALKRAERQFRLLVSPRFTDRESESLRETGFQPVDIRGMARRSGIDPGPLAEPPETAPSAGPPEDAAWFAPPPKRGRDDGPDFGM